MPLQDANLLHSFGGFGLRIIHEKSTKIMSDHK